MFVPSVYLASSAMNGLGVNRPVRQSRLGGVKSRPLKPIAEGLGFGRIKKGRGVEGRDQWVRTAVEAPTTIEGFSLPQQRAIEQWFSTHHYGINLEHPEGFTGTFDAEGVRINLFKNQIPFKQKVLEARGPVKDTCIGLAIAAQHHLTPVLGRDYELKGAWALDPACFNLKGDTHVVLQAIPKRGKDKTPLLIDPTFKRAGRLDGVMKGYQIESDPCYLDLFEVDNPIGTVRYDHWVTMGFTAQLMPSYDQPLKSKPGELSVVQLGYNLPSKGVPQPIVALKYASSPRSVDEVYPIQTWLKALNPTDPIVPFLKRLQEPDFLRPA